MIKHHLPDTVLSGYATGALPEAFNLLVATHISLCDECRARSEALDILGGVVLETLDTNGISLSKDAFEKTLALIATPYPTQKKRVRTDPRVPLPLEDYLNGGLDAIAWKPIGMGAKQAILAKSPLASARMLYIPAGKTMPHHSHSGLEMTMPLQGAILDNGSYFSIGDIACADETHHHTPTADAKTDCICIAVTEGKLRFSNLLPRLAQPFLSI